MTAVPRELERVDYRLTGWLARHGLTVLRISLGVVFLWFGVLKFFPGLSPAADLASRTIEKLSVGSVSASTSLVLLATLETVIGLGLLLRVFQRVILLLLVLQLLGTLTPFVLFPDEVFTRFPYALSLEGQFIVKNAVLIGAAMVLGATVRGGGLVPQPEVKRVGERLQATEPPDVL
jgi:uncharacterized membrane protein YphA (DoxX/SURF4 family)